MDRKSVSLKTLKEEGGKEMRREMETVCVCMSVRMEVVFEVFSFTWKEKEKRKLKVFGVWVLISCCLRQRLLD